MTNEEKQLLFTDLCGRLPYGVIVHSLGTPHEQKLIGYIPDIDHYNIKPYLRPMSSMTDEEKTKIASMAGHFNDLTKAIEICFACLPVVDYCYSRHLDFRGLIPMGLALKAPEDMYKGE